MLRLLDIPTAATAAARVSMKATKPFAHFWQDSRTPQSPLDLQHKLFRDPHIQPCPPTTPGGVVSLEPSLEYIKDCKSRPYYDWLVLL